MPLIHTVCALQAQLAKGATVTDFVTQLRRSIDRRLTELRPILEEASQLEDVLKRLGGRKGAGFPTRPATRRTAAESSRKGRPSKARRSAKGKRAPRGQNVAAILAVVGDRPGIRPSSVAEKTGIADGTVYATVSGGGLRVARRAVG